MLETEYETLVLQLHGRTAKGQVNWLSTADESVFLVQFKDYSCAVRQYHDEDDTYYSFTLRNQKGKTIDEFYISPMAPLYMQASQLFASARRKALKIDEALSSILSEIRSNESVGQVPDASGKDDDDSVPF